MAFPLSVASREKSLLLLHRCWCTTDGCPVVQVVGNVVALLAAGELGQQTSRVRRSVAVRALGYHLVFCLVAAYTQELVVLGFVGRQQLVCLGVTGAALLVGNIIAVGNGLGLVGFVAFFTLGLGHFGGVTFVALGTGRDFAVYVVAVGAVKGRVLALIFTKLGNLLDVAGEAGVRQVLAERDVLGLVRVFVTLKALVQLVVSLAFVALAALGNDVFNSRGVAIVAVLAADGSFVGHTGSFDVGRCFGVALDAVGVLQGRFRGIGGKCCHGKDQNGQCRNCSFFKVVQMH